MRADLLVGSVAARAVADIQKKNNPDESKNKEEVSTRVDSLLKGALGNVLSEKKNVDAPPPKPVVNNNFGPDQTRPEGDTRSAREIIDASPLLKNLGNQENVKDMLKEQVGDFENDADAAFRATEVLNHVQKFDEDGKVIADGDRGNDKINGFTSSDEARHGTEAGRLKDFGKYGYSSLKGSDPLPPPPAAPADDKPRPVVNEFGPKQTRPEGDERSAQEIIDSSPALKNLGNQSGVKDMLKEQVGDFDKDADAAYRATQVLENVQKFNSKGPVDSPSQDGTIDGFTSSDEAKPDTEAGRLQDFGKYGYSALFQGGVERNGTYTPNADEKRPEGDYRSAKEIIEGDPLLKNLGNQNGIRDGLKKQVGDFDKDADAAYRASQVLHNIEKFDETGTPIDKASYETTNASDSKDNDLVDGYNKKDEAADHSEARRLENFVKDGYSSLKSKEDVPPTSLGAAPKLPLEGETRPADDHRSAREIIDSSDLLKNLGNQEDVKDNLKKQVGDFEKDPDAAWRAVQVLDYVDKMGGKGKPAEGDDVGNGKVDGFTSSDEAKPDTEAGRLKDFGEKGYGALQGLDGKSADEKLSSLNADAVQSAIDEAHGDSKKVPDDYYKTGKSDASPADKVDALITLTSGLAEYQAGSSQMGSVDIKGEWDGGTYTSNAPFEADVQFRIDALKKDPDVQKFMSDAAAKKVPEAVNADPGLKAELERRQDVAASTGALQREFDKSGGDASAAVTAFVGKASSYAQALGKEPDLRKAFDNASPELKDKVKSAYENVVSGKQMQDDIKKGMSPNDALVHSAADRAMFDSVLDEKTTKDGDARFNEQAITTARGQLTDGKSPEDIYKGLGVKDANDPALQKLIDENTEKFTEPGTAPPRASDVMAVMRRVEDLMRHGASFDGAMKELDKNWKNLMPAGVGDTAKTGALHAASSVMMAGIIGSRSADGSKTNTLQDVGQALTAGSLLSSGTYKYLQDNAKEVFDNGKIFGSESADTMVKDVKNTLGTLGLAGDVIGLAYNSMSAKQSADKGDKLSAGFQGTFAALDGISSVAGAAELGAYLVPRLVPSVAAESVAGVSAAAGAVGAVAGGVAAIGGLIYSFVTGITNSLKGQKVADDFHSKMMDKFGEVNMKIPGHNAMIQNFDMNDEKGIFKNPADYDKWLKDQSNNLNGPD